MRSRAKPKLTFLINMRKDSGNIILQQLLIQSYAKKNPDCLVALWLVEVHQPTTCTAESADFETTSFATGSFRRMLRRLFVFLELDALSSRLLTLLGVYE